MPTLPSCHHPFSVLSICPHHWSRLYRIHSTACMHSRLKAFVVVTASSATVFPVINASIFAFVPLIALQARSSSLRINLEHTFVRSNGYSSNDCSKGPTIPQCCGELIKLNLSSILHVRMHMAYYLSLSALINLSSTHSRLLCHSTSLI